MPFGNELREWERWREGKKKKERVGMRRLREGKRGKEKE